MDMKKTLLFAGLAVSVVAAVAYGAQDQGATLKGKTMVPFKMTTTKGQTLTNASLKGKVVILDFWATWCPPCKAASPVMQNLHKKYAAKGLTIIGANTSEQRNADGAAAMYAKEHGYTYTFTKKNDALAQRLGVSGIPFFVFIGRDGKVADVATGFDPDSSPQRFEATVKRLLAKK